jgi:hypothetical protein
MNDEPPKPREPDEPVEPGTPSASNAKPSADASPRVYDVVPDEASAGEPEIRVVNRRDEREAIPKARLVDPQRERLEDSTRPGAMPAASSSANARQVDGESLDPPLITPGLGSAKVWALAGGVLCLSGVVAAAVNASRNPIFSGMLALYGTLVFTGLGVLAVALTAALLNRRAGSMEEAGLAGARMFAAVAAAVFVFHLNIQLIGAGKTEELLLAVAAYLTLVLVLFRWWGQALKSVLMMHVVLVIFTVLGWQLAAWAWAPAEKASATQAPAASERAPATIPAASAQ